MNKAKKIMGLLSFLMFFYVSINQYFNIYSKENESEELKSFSMKTDTIDEILYQEKLQSWHDQSLSEFHTEEINVDYEQFNNPLKIVPKNESYGYTKNTYLVQNNDSIEFTISSSSPKLYQIQFDFYSLSENINPFSFDLKINDAYPYRELSTLELNTLWYYEGEEVYDRYGNEVLSSQSQKRQWINQNLYDNQYFSKYPLLIYLDEEETKITLNFNQAHFLLGEIQLKGRSKELSYAQYFNQFSALNPDEILNTYEAEKMVYKNNSSIRPTGTKNNSAQPLSLIQNKLNILDGNQLSNAGHKISYEIDIEKEGLYQITLKGKQDQSKNKRSFYRLYINDVVPFDEAHRLSFEYSSKWKNYTLSKNQDEKYYFYFKSGINLISLEPTNYEIADFYHSINQMILEMNKLALDIRKMTGNNADSNRDWDMEKFIPGITNQFINWKEELGEILNGLRSLYQTQKNSLEMENLQTAQKKINQILDDIDKLPYKLTLFSEGSGCITQLLGTALENLIKSPLTLDQIHIHTDVKLPSANKNIFVSGYYSVKRFFMSFFVNQYDTDLEEGEINIWVNKSRQYVDVMQSLTDSVFTKKKNIKVKFSIMPDENKLILANASNSQPDVALGIHSFLPYQLAIRNAVYDLRNFEDYSEVIQNFADASLLPFTYENGLYAIPDTQNFQVLFYRKDLLNQLQIPIPETWEEVIQILPELQRYGMNFYTGIANGNSYKTFDVVLPYLMQANASIYKENGLEINLSSDEMFKAFEFMTELFTIYSLPSNVTSFYNHFRNGLLPIGIGDYNTYIQLLHAAPEIKGLWDIALIPGIRDQKTGEINRQSPGLSQGVTIFQKSKYKEAAWEFIKWWSSTETQVLYEQTLLTTYGKEYMYISANLNAFNLSNFDEKHKKIILKQWESLNNITLVPAYYMIEREFSNLWNKVVFSGIPIRDAMDQAEMTINREMLKKNIEFKYLDSKGKPLKNYPVCTIETIKEWKKNEN